MAYIHEHAIEFEGYNSGKVNAYTHTHTHKKKKALDKGKICAWTAIQCNSISTGDW
jgi:hypothetical protein